MCSFFLSLVILLTNPDGKIISLAKEKQITYDVSNQRYVVIIDYSKSIDEERLYVVDMLSSKIVLRSIVSHGKNSGGEYPIDFSNEFGTLKSSLGGFVTKNTYYGNWGYSLVVRGLDKGVNSNAEERRIVFHSSKKMTTKWSWGCFATPDSINSKLINLIKGGCLVFVFK